MDGQLVYVNGRFVPVADINPMDELRTALKRLSVATNMLALIGGSTSKDAEEMKRYARTAQTEIERTYHVEPEGEDAEGEAGADEEGGQASDAAEAEEAGPVAPDGEGGSGDGP